MDVNYMNIKDIMNNIICMNIKIYYYRFTLSSNIKI